MLSAISSRPLITWTPHSDARRVGLFFSWVAKYRSWYRIHWTESLPLVKLVHPIRFCKRLTVFSSPLEVSAATWSGFCVHPRMCHFIHTSSSGSVFFYKVHQKSVNNVVLFSVELGSGHRKTWSWCSPPWQHRHVVILWGLHRRTIFATRNQPCMNFLIEFWWPAKFWIALWNSCQAISLKTLSDHWHFCLIQQTYSCDIVISRIWWIFLMVFPW